MSAETEKFEKATLTAFYYTIRRGVDFDPIDKAIYDTLKSNPKASGVNLYNKQVAPLMVIFCHFGKKTKTIQLREHTC